MNGVYEGPSVYGGHLDLEGTKVTSLGNLKEVGSNLYLRGTQVKDLGNLKEVRGSLYIGDSYFKLQELQELKELVSEFNSMDLTDLPVYMEHECLLIRNIVKHRLETGK